MTMHGAFRLARYSRYNPSTSRRAFSGPEGVHCVPILHHEPELSDSPAIDAIRENLELSTQALALALGEYADKGDRMRFASQNVDKLGAYGTAGEFTGPRPETSDLRLADIITGEEVPAGDVPDDVIGENLHECA